MNEYQEVEYFVGKVKEYETAYYYFYYRSQIYTSFQKEYQNKVEKYSWSSNAGCLLQRLST